MGTVLKQIVYKFARYPSCLSFLSLVSVSVDQSFLYQVSGQVEMYRHVMEQICVCENNSFTKALSYVVSFHDEAFKRR